MNNIKKKNIEVMSRVKYNGSDDRVKLYYRPNLMLDYPELEEVLSHQNLRIFLSKLKIEVPSICHDFCFTSIKNDKRFDIFKFSDILLNGNEEKNVESIILSQLKDYIGSRYLVEYFKKEGVIFYWCLDRRITVMFFTNKIVI